MPSPNHLIALPTELKLIIASNLSPAETQLLRMTCRHFYALLPRPTLSDLYSIVTSAYNHRFYTLCFDCRRLLPETNFLPHPDQSEPWKRAMVVCRKCGEPTMLCKEVYGPGTEKWEGREAERRRLGVLRREGGLNYCWGSIGK